MSEIRGKQFVHQANIPEKLKLHEQWVVWRYEARQFGGKQTKVPYVATHSVNAEMTKAKSNDPSTWTSFETALAALEADTCLDGLGFCFSSKDDLVGIDLDHCFDENHNLLPWAKDIVVEFGETYIEISPSGDGLHIWCRGKAIKAARRTLKKREDGTEEAVEIYDCTSPRYFTVTGKTFKE
jgi:putative DNA primase/helicase